MPYDGAVDRRAKAIINRHGNVAPLLKYRNASLCGGGPHVRHASCELLARLDPFHGVPAMPSVMRKGLALVAFTTIMLGLGWFALSGISLSMLGWKPGAARSETSPPSMAERLVTIRRLIDLDEARRAELQTLDKRLDREFNEASESFERLDKQLTPSPTTADNKTAAGPISSEAQQALEAERRSKRKSSTG